MHRLVQTERIGPFLGGSTKVIEGCSYDDAGAARFNAFGIVSYDPATRSYSTSPASAPTSRMKSATSSSKAASRCASSR
jgi:hypothetical protein